MRKVKSKRHFALIGIATMLLFLHFSSSHPTNSSGGYTGAPGDSVCLQCHNESSAIDGTIELIGVPTTAIPGNTYPITVSINNTVGSASRAGFQMVALKTSTNTNTGSFSIPASENKAIVKVVNGKDYAGHNNSARTFTNNLVEYEVEWTAPTDQDGEEIKFYAATLIGNGSGSSGDQFVNINVTSMIEGGADPLEVSFSNIQGVLCQGEENGTATAEAMGGVADYTYDWDNGESGATATMLSAGNHTVTVTDSEGTFITGEVDIDDSPALSIQVSFQSDVTCFGESDGEAEVQASGGTGNLTIQWSNGGTGNFQGNLPAGLLVVTVTDGNGCTAETEVEINQPDEISLTVLELNDPSCNGDDDGSIIIEASGGTGGLTYDWQTNLGDPIQGTITNLPAGEYTLVVTDANGCTASTTNTLNDPSEISVTLTVTDETCQGASDGSIASDVTGGTPDYTYEWSNGETTSSISNLSPGIYMATITDSNGCIATTFEEVTEGTTFTTTIEVISQPLCGNATGELLASTAGANGNVSFVWSTGATTASISSLSAGTYSVTATDDSNCSSTAEVMLSDDSNLQGEVTSQTDVSCPGGNDGAASLAASGGTEPFIFTWPDGTAMDTRTDLSAGIYNVMVSDAAGCMAFVEVTIGEPTGFAFGEIIINNQCPSSSTGSIELNVTGGTGDYTYEWSNGESSSSIENLDAGTYDCTITDANSCLIVFSGIVENESSLSLEISSTPILCNGQSDATITVEANGGNEPYDYAWSDDPTINENVRTGLPAGEYSCTVTDASGCGEDMAITITEPPMITVDSEIVNESAEGAADGLITVTPSGGTGSFSYLWDNGNTTNMISDLSAGDYMVTITDSNGCFAEITYSVNGPGCVDALVIQNNSEIVCFGMTDGEISVALESGNTNVTYVWDNGSTSGTISDLGAGIYSVTATTEDGCQYSIDNISISENPEIGVVAIDVTPVSSAGVSDGAITIGAEGGTGTLAFEWFDDNNQVFSMEQNVSNLSVGTYHVCVTDENACNQLSDPIVISVGVGVEELDKSKFEVYPNPAQNVLNIKTDILADIKEVILTDLTGKQYFLESSFNTNSVSLNTTNLNTGSYMLQIYTSTSVESKMILISK